MFLILAEQRRVCDVQEGSVRVRRDVHAQVQTLRAPTKVDDSRSSKTAEDHGDIFARRDGAISYRHISLPPFDLQAWRATTGIVLVNSTCAAHQITAGWIVGSFSNATHIDSAPCSAG